MRKITATDSWETILSEINNICGCQMFTIRHHENDEDEFHNLIFRHVDFKDNAYFPMVDEDGDRLFSFYYIRSKGKQSFIDKVVFDVRVGLFNKINIEYGPKKLNEINSLKKIDWVKSFHHNGAIAEPFIIPEEIPYDSDGYESIFSLGQN